MEGGRNLKPAIVQVELEKGLQRDFKSMGERVVIVSLLTPSVMVVCGKSRSRICGFLRFAFFACFALTFLW